MKFEIIWPYLVAIVSAGYVLYEKIATRWKEKAVVRQAYNRLFTKTMKVLHALYKRKEILDNALNMPQSALFETFHLVDELAPAVTDLKEALQKDEGIVPEVVLSTHFMFDLLDRFQLAERVKVVPTDEHPEEQQRHLIRKATMDMLYPKTFDLICLVLQVLVTKSSVKKETLENLLQTYSTGNLDKNRKIDSEMMAGYFKSVEAELNKTNQK